MDIYDINQQFDITLRKLRRMEKAGVLRTGKSQIPHHWQMVRSDIRKGKLSARSIVLAYRYPSELEKIMEISSGHRRVIQEHVLKAEMPDRFPPPIESGPGISTIVLGAATDGGVWMSRFMPILKQHIPGRPVEYLYVAVRILLMCKNEWDIAGAAKYLCRALLKARDDPEMEGWWHREKTTVPNSYRTIYHRPDTAFDL